VKLDLLPSEYFQRNIYTTFLIDQVGVNNRYAIGVDRMMWMCDFPHSVSNWPIDVELAHAQLKAGGVPPGRMGEADVAHRRRPLPDPLRAARRQGARRLNPCVGSRRTTETPFSTGHPR